METSAVLEIEQVLISLRNKLEVDRRICLETASLLSKTNSMTGSCLSLTPYLEMEEDFKARISLVDKILTEMSVNNSFESLQELTPLFDLLKNPSFLVDLTPQTLN